MKVVVFGGSSFTDGDVEYELALDIGSILGERGFEVVSGGYSGIMEAVSRGSRDAGGAVRGIVHTPPDILPPNQYVTIVEQADDYLDRMARLLRIPFSIALPGASGTVAEIAVAYALLYRQRGRQLLLWEPYWRGRIADSLGMNESVEGLAWASSREDVTKWCEKLAGIQLD